MREVKEEVCPEKRAQKKGKRFLSHRYDRLPLLPSGPGGVHQELVVGDLPAAKVRAIQGM